jgi:hypothetical protein
MDKETKEINGYVVCVNFDMTTYFCILEKSSRFCDGVCIYVKNAKKNVPLLPERD